MLLPDYLAEYDEHPADFSARAGIPYGTIRSILAGGGTSADTAVKIVRATRGLVNLHDLVRRKKAKGAA